MQGGLDNYISNERRYQRASCALPAEFDWGTISNQALVRVIGIGGAFISTNALVPLDERLDLNFRLAEKTRPIQCRCRVAWLTGRGIEIRGEKHIKGFAVEFTRIYPEDRQLIDEYVRDKIRVYKAISHELKKKRPDKALVKELFGQVRPGESTHLNHIKKACREEAKFYRLRK